MTINLYSFFHLNLAYSAIEEEARPLVIDKCYWPLLRLAKKGNYPFGIELSGYTLESINRVDPSWVKELSLLVTEGACELIGSGYSQIIGPLVPPEVTLKNLRIGDQIYKETLGVKPTVALLNEQAFSSGLVSLYAEAGYKAVIMEWNNAAKENINWDEEWRYLPQRAQGNDDVSIDLIWNKSISFQKFQRYVHGEIELEEMLEYLNSHKTALLRAFPLYGNDIEIFDFRPGRYMTETDIHVDGEWERINKLFSKLHLNSDFKFIKPSAVLNLKKVSKADNLLKLSSAAQPIPVKKQDKYNIIRWAVSGRNDFDINTRCWKLLENINKSSSKTDNDWKELLYLWSSDFRTHITQLRWTEYLERLNKFEKVWLSPTKGMITSPKKSKVNTEALKIERIGKLLKVSGKRLQIEFNCMRGLALESFTDLDHCETPLIGTLQHGYFDDITWSADFYSGHLVFESPGKHKITDLISVTPDLSESEKKIFISGMIECSLGQITKTWVIDDLRGSLKLIYDFNWPEPALGSLRLGFLTLFPNSFDSRSLYFGAHNGGMKIEHFDLSSNVDHGKPVSFLVSANQAVGATDGLVEIGDKHKGVRVSFNPSDNALIGLVTHQNIRDSHLTRISLSARELDDTSKPNSISSMSVELEFSAFSGSFKNL